ncbi:MAG: LytTR family DNA-binding domain-containing protein [Bacteroidia bacterium]|nr:LytTR family DNA-binding domain-containing protein [Bacteroidia bacterium]
MSLRAIIADDEAAARNRVLRLLKQIENTDVVVVSSVENGLDALQSIELERPDIAFLDIEMPGMNGLEVARRASELGTKVIFTTAHNEHAIAAFEIDAADYLLKPIDKERLKTCLERVKNRSVPIPMPDVEVDTQLTDINYMDLNKIPIPVADKIKLIDFSDIFTIEVEEGETYIYSKEKRYLLNQTLEHFEKRLPPKQFLRISRSCIVNVAQIKELVVWFGNRYKVILNNGREAISSRERSRVIKQILKF